MLSQREFMAHRMRQCGFLIEFLYLILNIVIIWNSLAQDGQLVGIAYENRTKYRFLVRAHISFMQKLFMHFSYAINTFMERKIA